MRPFWRADSNPAFVRSLAAHFPVTPPLFDRFSANRPAAGCRRRNSLDSLMNRALTIGSTGPAGRRSQ